jgi:AcrR family transcriptional regulator
MAHNQAVEGISPTSQPRPRDAEATRRALLRAAQRRFALLGYERTTTRDIARDAGVNLTLINRYFGGKEGLFRAVLAASPDPLTDAGASAGAGTGTGTGAGAAPGAEAARGDVVTDFLDGLRPGAWSEFGGHPLLLLLRDSGAEEIRALRSTGLAGTITRIIEWSGGQRGDREPATELPAQLVLALFCGIVALRSLTPIEPLASADVDDLRPAVENAIAALLDPHPRPPRTSGSSERGERPPSAPAHRPAP